MSPLCRRPFLYALYVPLTARFATRQIPGWITHWMETHVSAIKKICRPRPIYTGDREREFVSLHKL